MRIEQQQHQQQQQQHQQQQQQQQQQQHQQQRSHCPVLTHLVLALTDCCANSTFYMLPGVVVMGTNRLWLLRLDVAMAVMASVGQSEKQKSWPFVWLEVGLVSPSSRSLCPEPVQVAV